MPTLEQYYVSPDKVMRYLGLIPSTIETDSDFYLEVCDAIEGAMEQVDSATRTTWNGRRKQVTEIHSLSALTGMGYVMSVWWGLGYYFPLTYKPLTKINSITYPYGSDTPKEFITDDADFGNRDSYNYYIERLMGNAYLKYFMPHRGGDEVGIIYTYGQDRCPKDIEQFTKFVAADILLNSDVAHSVLPDHRNIKGSSINEVVQRKITQYVGKYRKLKPTNAWVDYADEIEVE